MANLNVTATESSTLSESVLLFLLSIKVSDTVTTSENSLVWTFAPPVADTTSTAENVNVAISKGFLDCYFNNDNLNDIPNVLIYAIELHDQATRNIKSYPLARADGLKLVNAQYAVKTVVVDGVIAAPTRANLETARDTLLKFTEAQEGNLRFPQAGADRNYTATLAVPTWTDKSSGGFAPFSLQFVCSDPLGYDTNNTTDVNAATITTQPSIQSFTAIGGSIKAQPTFTVTVNSGTGLSAAPLSLTDASNNVLTVTRTWAVGDVLSINCKTKAVTVNTVAVDYSGVFPVLQVGDTAIQYSDGFASRNVTLTVTHKNSWK